MRRAGGRCELAGGASWGRCECSSLLPLLSRERRRSPNELYIELSYRVRVDEGACPSQPASLARLERVGETSYGYRVSSIGSGPLSHSRMNEEVLTPLCLSATGSVSCVRRARPRPRRWPPGLRHLLPRWPQSAQPRSSRPGEGALRAPRRAAPRRARAPSVVGCAGGWGRAGAAGHTHPTPPAHPCRPAGAVVRPPPPPGGPAGAAVTAGRPPPLSTHSRTRQARPVWAATVLTRRAPPPS